MADFNAARYLPPCAVKPTARGNVVLGCNILDLRFLPFIPNNLVEKLKDEI